MALENNEIIVSIDIGTSKIFTLVGCHKEDSSIEIIGHGISPCDGLRKGSVISIDQTIQSIKSSTDQAFKMSGIAISNADIGIAGSHIFSFTNNGVVAIKGGEVSKRDISRAISVSKTVVIPSEREILHVLPVSYKVDELSDIKDPLGMNGRRLEIISHIVTGNVSAIQNLVKCVEGAGISVDSITLQPIASSEVVLTKEEKETGVVLIDIGAGTTDIIVWYKGGSIYSGVIPIGGDHFTNDLMVALNVNKYESEKIKINYGNVILESNKKSAYVTVHGLKGTRPREVPLSLITDILNMRANELFQIIQNLLEEKKLKDKVVGGYVITGGGSLLRSISSLGQFVFEKPTKRGYPVAFEGKGLSLQSPKYSCALGLLDLSHKKKIKIENELKEQKGKNDLISKLNESLKNIFKEIF